MNDLIKISNTIINTENMNTFNVKTGELTFNNKEVLKLSSKECKVFEDYLEHAYL